MLKERPTITSIKVEHFDKFHIVEENCFFHE